MKTVLIIDKTSNLKKALAFLGLLFAFLLTGPVLAGDYVRNMPYEDAQGVLVRSYTQNQCVVCNSKPTGECIFTLVTNGVTPLYKMYVNIDSVLDFEIYQGYVYFCGWRTNNVQKNGVLGYFDINQMPNAVVYYFDLPWVQTLKKMDAGGFVDGTHMVAVGTETSGKTTIIDAAQQGSFWTIDYGVIDSTKYSFYDVAITDSHVVATVGCRHLPLMLFFDEVLCFFKKPSVPGYSPLYQRNFYSTGSWFMGTYLIAHGVGNEFYTVSNSTRGSDYNLLSLMGTTPITKVNFSLESFSTIQDLRFNPLGNALNLLITTSQSTPISRIYNFREPLALATLTDGHSYNKATLTSLDVINGDQTHFVAAGRGASGFSGLHLCEYAFNNWGTCLGFLNLNCTTGAFELHERSVYFHDNHINMVPETMYGQEKQLIINTICGQRQERE